MLFQRHPRGMGLRELVFGVAGALALIATSGAVKGEDVRLAYKFKAGQTLYYEVNNRSTIESQMRDVYKETAAHESQAIKSLRVLSVDEAGAAVVEPVIDQVRMQATFNGTDPISYDSTKDDEPPFQFRHVAATIGKTTARLKFAATGELLEIQPVGENFKSPVGNAKFDPKYNFLVIFPPNPVSVGSSWKEKLMVPVTVNKTLTRDIPLQRTYTLARIDGKYAQIRFTTAILMPLDDPELQGQLMQRTPNGLIEFDLEEGVIATHTTEVNQKVFDALGPQTITSAVSTSVEKRISGPPAQTAAKPVSSPAQ